MMGSSHAWSGVAAWLGGSVVAAHYGYHQTPAQLAVGTALCAGGALLPDLDQSGAFLRDRGGATIARTFGRAGLAVAEVVEKTSLGVYNLTRTRLDPPRDSGHRTLTHTLAAVAPVGVGAWAAGAYGGRWGLLALLFVLFLAALRALLAKWCRRKWWWWVSSLFAAGASLAATVALEGGRGYPLLGLAVGAGYLTHLAGDWITVAGVPLTWPLVYRGRRWWMWHLGPIKAGCPFETLGLRWLFAASGVVFALMLAGPAFTVHG